MIIVIAAKRKSGSRANRTGNLYEVRAGVSAVLSPMFPVVLRTVIGIPVNPSLMFPIDLYQNALQTRQPLF